MVIEFLLHEEFDGDYGEVHSCSYPNRYANLSFIGRGSFGNVYRADDGNEKVAIKSIALARYSGNRHDLKKVAREAMILYFIDCRQMVKLKWMYTTGTRADSMQDVNLVMSYCGVDLVEFICTQERERLPLTLDQMSYIIYQISLGINYLNSMDVYHRDLKPSNVCVLCNDGHFQHVKIIDLGMARTKPRMAVDLTRRIATVSYRAPEMMLGDTYEEKLDIWSIGCILGYMVKSGRNRHLFLPSRDVGHAQALTMRKVIEQVGKPSQSMINRIQQRQSLIDPHIYDQIVSCLENNDIPVESTYFDEMFNARFQQDDTTDGIALLKGMLKWDPEERYSIQQVLESGFVRQYRCIEEEAAPPANICKAIKGILEFSEGGTKGKSFEELKVVIFDHIVRFYLVDDKGETYPYQAINLLKRVRPLTMRILKPIGVAGVVLAPFALYRFWGYTARQAVVTSGMALFFVLGGSLIVEKFFSLS